MEITWSARWILCIAVISLTSLVKLGHCAGAKCWYCAHATNDTACRTPANAYLPETAVIDSFCTDLRKEDVWVKELCNDFPAGYKVLCETSMKEEIKCSSTVCPKITPAAHQGSDAISQHAPSFVIFIMAATIVSVSRI
ncbi:uncharacterized protein [Littorina saxatilis]|uniref:Protein sleepless n=1 Tax=Littorina saxatilis TaxID=31220 RepID=A0AAN9G1C0_9CAEN